MIRQRPWIVACLMVVSIPTLRGIATGSENETPRFQMSKPVFCRKIHGFASFEERSDSRFTADDKMTIYTEPTGYRIDKTKDGFHALFTEDARVRKKGNKDSIWKKDKLSEYEAVNKNRPYQIYLRTEIGLKGLPPGDYELDLILHDRLDKSDVGITRTLAFTIYEPRVQDDAKPEKPEKPSIK